MLQVLESKMDKPIIQSIRPSHKNFDLRNAIDVRLHISSENAKWERERERERVWEKAVE